jgi:DNA-binding GntR family transcriptional regulator
MSPVAYKLYTHLRQQEEGANLVMEELTRVLSTSKTAIRAAFEELSIEGLLTYVQEG